MKTSNKSVAKNAVLNVIKTICNIAFPLITIPYVSRILHVENVGKYNFANSIVNYFSLFASLGISTFAIREGSRLREDRNKIDKFSSNVFTINLISTLLSYIALIICVLVFRKLQEDKAVIYILSISIILTTIGCEWIFNIYEDFEYITIRTIVIQIVSAIALFMIVKSKDDLLNYALISVISSSGANILNAITRRKYCKVRITFNKDLIRMLKPIMLLFFNNIATTVFVNSDVTMLGILSGNYATGLYSISSKIYIVVKSLLSAIIIVSIPRLSACLTIGNNKLYKQMADNIFDSLITIVAPTVVGMFALSKNIICIIGGNEYIKATSSLKILSIALIFSIFSWFYSDCVLIANRKDKELLLATTTAAIVNVVLNFILIPFFNQNAAAVTTVIAEFISVIICVCKSDGIYKYKVNLKELLVVFLGCAGIMLICYLSTTFINSVLLSTITAVLVSILVYFILLKITNNRVLNYFLRKLNKKNY